MKPRPDNPATNIKGKRHGPPVKEEADHYMNCPICGQAFDMRELGEVLHHNQPEHEPLPVDS